MTSIISNKKHATFMWFVQLTWIAEFYSVTKLPMSSQWHCSHPHTVTGGNCRQGELYRVGCWVHCPECIFPILPTGGISSILNEVVCNVVMVDRFLPWDGLVNVVPSNFTGLDWAYSHIEHFGWFYICICMRWKDILYVSCRKLLWILNCYNGLLK